MWLWLRVSGLSRKADHPEAGSFHLRLFSSPPFTLPIKVVVCVGGLLDLGLDQSPSQALQSQAAFPGSPRPAYPFCRQFPNHLSTLHSITGDKADLLDPLPLNELTHFDMNMYEPKMSEPDITNPMNPTRSTPTYIYVMKLILYLVLLLLLICLGGALIVGTLMGILGELGGLGDYFTVMVLPIWVVYLTLFGWLGSKVVGCAWRLMRGCVRG